MHEKRDDAVAVDFSAKSSHPAHSESSQLPSSHRESGPDPLNLPPPSTFRRRVQGDARSTTIPERQDLPGSLLASVRQSIASDVASCESACWSESAEEWCKWQDDFKAFDMDMMIQD